MGAVHRRRPVGSGRRLRQIPRRRTEAVRREKRGSEQLGPRLVLEPRARRDPAKAGDDIAQPDVAAVILPPHPAAARAAAHYHEYLLQRLRDEAALVERLYD